MIPRLLLLGGALQPPSQPAPGVWYSTLSVADTGAGPNLNRADCIPPEILANLNRDRRIFNLASASKRKLNTIGVMYLWMDMGGYACRQPFVVVRRLAADVIIGCTFLKDQSICKSGGRSSYLRMEPLFRYADMLR